MQTEVRTRRKHLVWLGHTSLLFWDRGTGPKRSGTVLACFWTDVQAKPSILDPIRAILDDLGPDQHFGPDLDFQDQARVPGTGWEALAQPIFLFLTKQIKHTLFVREKMNGLDQGLPASPSPGTSQALPTPGDRDSWRLGLSVRSWLAEAAQQPT